MRFIEVIVNVPIRRSFSRQALEGPPPEPEFFGGMAELDSEPTASAEPETQSFHYHLPPELETIVQPGHLVWVPFGAREVQGFVLGFADSSPVPTKAVLRLARKEPVLISVQLELAQWLAQAYVAPLAEAIKLFLPPGLLSNKDGETSVRAKRELQVRWTGGALSVDEALARLARETQQTRILAWLLEQDEEAVAISVLINVLELTRAKATAAVNGLVEKGIISHAGAEIRLAVTPEKAQQLLAGLRGVGKYAPIVETLRAAAAPMWKSELYAEVDADLSTLRKLQDEGLVVLDERIRFRDPLAGRIYAPTTAPSLTGEQAAVWAKVRSQGTDRLTKGVLRPGKSIGFLIHGVTGSGKTEIYLHAIAEALAHGRQAIVLVPEIALTPQTVARFAGRFPGRVTVVHSGLSRGERYDVWRKVREGAFDVVVGPRSALFAPLPRLGLIVVDEEHEPSYKQDAEVWGSYKIYYDARATARKLADLVGGMVIFGSATPSMESYYAAQQGALTLLNMPRRVLGHGVAAEAVDGTLLVPVAYNELPPVEVVDMRLELRAGNRSILSRSLQSELRTTLDAGQQAILFLNRRGSSTFVMCRDCGKVEECPRCDVPLTYHERANQLICHHCNQRYPIPVICANCQSKRIRFFGSGTQRIEDLVHEFAPEARVLRWDADTARHRGGHETILQQFANHEADVLVGTQMIAKGLDLPLVTLVGVVAADVGLYLPDFRAGERTFQLLTQVAGRAGRSRHGGRVVIQSYTPDHYVIQAAAQHDFTGFYRREVNYREEYRYPPLRRMARLVYWEKKVDKAQAEAEKMAATIQRRLRELGLGPENATMIGPAPAFFARFRGYYRWQLLLLTNDPAVVLHRITIPFGWRVDVDPVSVL
jgi:primosomal protein N' (replication factor Y) (superfamily II helicase)